MRLNAGLSFLFCLLPVISVFGSCESTVKTENITFSATEIVTITSPYTQAVEIPISRDQAVAIASQYLPPDSLRQSRITAELGLRTEISSPKIPAITLPYSWIVSFVGFSTSRSELASFGWKDENQTYFPDFSGKMYRFAAVNVDANTGEVLFKEVSVLEEPLSPSEVSIVSLPTEHPIDTISVVVHVPNPPNPGGPTVEVTFKNVSDKPVVFLMVSLGLEMVSRSEGFLTLPSDVSASNPFTPGQTITSERLLNGAGYETYQYYPVFISGKFQDGSTFEYIQYVEVSTG
jgi:hypothetical protein